MGSSRGKLASAIGPGRSDPGSLFLKSQNPGCKLSFLDESVALNDSVTPSGHSIFFSRQIFLSERSSLCPLS